VRHRLLKWWPVLWQQFGITPLDVERLTLIEVVSIEAALEQWAQQNR
jgi:hypothetical protein